MKKTLRFAGLERLKIHLKTHFQNSLSHQNAISKIPKFQNFQIFLNWEKFEFTARDKHLKIPILNLWTTWEKIHFVTAENKMGNFHKIRLLNLNKWVRYSYFDGTNCGKVENITHKGLTFITQRFMLKFNTQNLRSCLFETINKHAKPSTAQIGTSNAKQKTSDIYKNKYKRQIP